MRLPSLPKGPRVVVIEGPDATGKSSIANRLVDRDTAPARVLHNTAADAKLPGSLYLHYRNQLREAVQLREIGVSTYIDRSFLSEYVYGRVYRGKPRITAAQARRLERFARRRGIVLLGMTAAANVRRERMLARGESWAYPQDPFVGGLYFQWFREHPHRWTIVDSSSA